MKALTLWEPWATLVAIGAKRYETRGWSTRYRGPLLIHAAVSGARAVKIVREAYARQMANPLTLAALDEANAWPCQGGIVVALVDLVDVRRMDDEFVEAGAREVAFGIWSPGRFAFRLENLRPLIRFPAKPEKPRHVTPDIPARGHQLLWNPSAELVAQVEAALSSEVAAHA